MILMKKMNYFTMWKYRINKKNRVKIILIFKLDLKLYSRNNGKYLDFIWHFEKKIIF